MNDLNELRNKNNTLLEENNRLKFIVSTLNNKILDLNNTIVQLENTNINLKNEIDNYKNNINELTSENASLLDKIKNLNEINKVENLSKEKDEMLLSLMKKLEDKENQMKILKSTLPFELKDGEELLTIIFSTENEEIYYSLICKDNEKFKNVENRFYEIYPQYENDENYFTFNGTKITKSKTLKENGIKCSNIIMINNK